MSNISESETMSSCANCGEGEEASINLKACAACRLVKYCNRECQIAHRPQHKKACKKRAAELHDEKLFKTPPPLLDDCPICMIRLPTLATGRSYKACCGKLVCSGCAYAPVFDHEGNIDANGKCPFCRTPAHDSDEEIIKRLEKRIELNDFRAMYSMGYYYAEGLYGLPQKHAKALELWHRAADLGHAGAHTNIGYSYKFGRGLEVDEKKAIEYTEIAAMRGCVEARNNLGLHEEGGRNYDRALKHYMIAAKGGSAKSLNNIKLLFSEGYATKDDYANALRSYQAHLDDIKSDQRDKAAAARENYQYYGSFFT